MTKDDLDQLAINTIRTLSIDAVQQAKSGHPGTPMALAPLVYAIWNRVTRFDPKDPIWPDRDRFVLSNGHPSMLLWSVLHLTGTQAVNAEYESLGKPSVTLDDIRHFRRLDSKAPGHPEYHILRLRHQPAVIALSRQPLPTFDRSKYASAAGVARGAYVMAESPGGPARHHPHRLGQRGLPGRRGP
jgi:transketolase